jgi:stage III sporulation protein SpoIIIAA
MVKESDNNIQSLFSKLPLRIVSLLTSNQYKGDLLEVVLDLGREPEARFSEETVVFPSLGTTTESDIEHVVSNIGEFGDDNRAGIERTLHRISAFRNRKNSIVGLTIRVGRSVQGTIKIIEDLVIQGKSILLLGKPGVGKTTMLREIARVLADDNNKRVVVVDTSNEIAGDGDIPHSGIGRARRMQVPTPVLQHSVMIEAVENHMPEVIIIDEIGTELETSAARTIAERGVQLIATAHGNTIDNLILNPTLSDLIGGIQSVTLGDIEAKNRKTQKTVLERRNPPTFDIIVEIQEWRQVAIHNDVSLVVDQMLRGNETTVEIRAMDQSAKIKQTELVRKSPLGNKQVSNKGKSESRYNGHASKTGLGLQNIMEDNPITKSIFPYGVNRGKIEQVIKSHNLPINIVSKIEETDYILTTKNFYRRRTKLLKDAELKGKPVYVLRRNAVAQIHQFFKSLVKINLWQNSNKGLDEVVDEVEKAVSGLNEGNSYAELSPQSSYIRRVQHQMAEQYGLESSSNGVDPDRKVVLFKRVNHREL